MDHTSDCAIHNAPAYLPTSCDCQRQVELEKALKRAAKKMMVMALSLESLGEEWGDAAVQMRREAAIAFDALHENENENENED